MTDTPRFHLGRLDHVHIRVPDQAEAVAWYAENLGFEPIERFDFWASSVEDGPIQITADGGVTSLALFKASDAHPMIPQQTGVAFSVDAAAFAQFVRSLPNGIDSPAGRPLVPADVVDFDLCWAYDFVDPWENRYELNCYDYDRVKAEVIEADAITATRYWRDDLYPGYLRRKGTLPEDT